MAKQYDVSHSMPQVWADSKAGTVPGSVRPATTGRKLTELETQQFDCESLLGHVDCIVRCCSVLQSSQEGQTNTQTEKCLYHCFSLHKVTRYMQPLATTLVCSKLQRGVVQKDEDDEDIFVFF